MFSPNNVLSDAPSVTMSELSAAREQAQGLLKSNAHRGETNQLRHAIEELHRQIIWELRRSLGGSKEIPISLKLLPINDDWRSDPTLASSWGDINRLPYVITGRVYQDEVRGFGSGWSALLWMPKTNHAVRWWRYQIAHDPIRYHGSMGITLEEFRYVNHKWRAAPTECRFYADVSAPAVKEPLDWVNNILWLDRTQPENWATKLAPLVRDLIAGAPDEVLRKQLQRVSIPLTEGNFAALCRAAGLWPKEKQIAYLQWQALRKIPPPAGVTYESTFGLGRLIECKYQTNLADPDANWTTTAEEVVSPERVFAALLAINTVESKVATAAAEQVLETAAALREALFREDEKNWTQLYYTAVEVETHLSWRGG